MARGFISMLSGEVVVQLSDTDPRCKDESEKPAGGARRC